MLHDADPAGRYDATLPPPIRTLASSASRMSSYSSQPPPGRMQPLSHWSAASRRALIGVFTDIDDTLTTEGAITADALRAMAALRASGLHLIAITGRPAGWSEPFACTWPLDAIVAENGAVALLPRSGGGVEKRYQQDAPTRAANFERMQQVLRLIECEVPGARRAADSAGRECDIAIDHSEFTQLDEARIEAVATLMRSEGMHATVSSIHVNGWYGGHDKLEGARWIVRELWGRALDDESERWAYVGDSTNDALMFAHFSHSIGVANVRRFERALPQLPRYVAPSERGAGFAEVAQAILDAITER